MSLLGIDFTKSNLAYVGYGQSWQGVGCGCSLGLWSPAHMSGEIQLEEKG